MKIGVKFLFATILSLLMLSPLNVTAQVSVQVKAPSSVMEGNKFTLTFSVKNGECKDVNAPELTGCTLLFGPSVSQMHSYSYVNGQSTSVSMNDYSFTYKANKAGKVNVPPVTFVIGGKSYTSKATSFTIHPGNGKSANTSPSKGNINTFDDEVSSLSADKPVTGSDVFVRIIMSKNTCYEQEAIVCTIKLFTKYGIQSFMATQQPAFDGFLVEELEVPQGSMQEQVNGRNYYTAVLKRCILYPQKSGKLTITSGKYDLTVEQLEEYSIGPFRDVRPVPKEMKINSNTGSLNVMPLPQPQPDGFNGAVGHFTVEAHLSDDVLRTNETSSLIFTVKGTGNIKYLKEPKVNFPESFDLYTPKTDVNASSTGDDMTGTISHEFTFAPQQIGKFVIPSIPFVYFDPTSKSYVTLTTTPINANVAKGAGGASAESVEKKNTDILHIKTDNHSVSRNHTLLVERPWFWMIYIVFALGLLAAVVLSRKSAIRNADVTKMKMSKANKVARKRLKEARTLIQSHKFDKFYEELLRAVWGYLSDKMAMPVSDLTRDNVSARLTDIGADIDTINNVIYVLDECEMSRYTPSNSDSKVEDLYNKAAQAINNLETIKRKEK